MINAFSLLVSQLKKYENYINSEDFMKDETKQVQSPLSNIDKKLYNKIYNREVDNVDILSIILFTKLSIIYDYNYEEMCKYLE